MQRAQYIVDTRQTSAPERCFIPDRHALVLLACHTGARQSYAGPYADPRQGRHGPHRGP